MFRFAALAEKNRQQITWNLGSDAQVDCIILAILLQQFSPSYKWKGLSNLPLLRFLLFFLAYIFTVYLYSMLLLLLCSLTLTSHQSTSSVYRNLIENVLVSRWPCFPFLFSSLVPFRFPIFFLFFFFCLFWFSLFDFLFNLFLTFSSSVGFYVHHQQSPIYAMTVCVLLLLLLLCVKCYCMKWTCRQVNKGDTLYTLALEK